MSGNGRARGYYSATLVALPWSISDSPLEIFDVYVVDGAPKRQGG
jgi:hypothetical protein